MFQSLGYIVSQHVYTQKYAFRYALSIVRCASIITPRTFSMWCLLILKIETESLSTISLTFRSFKNLK